MVVDEGAARELLVDVCSDMLETETATAVVSIDEEHRHSDVLSDDDVVECGGLEETEENAGVESIVAEEEVTGRGVVITCCVEECIRLFVGVLGLNGDAVSMNVSPAVTLPDVLKGEEVLERMAGAGVVLTRVVGLNGAEVLTKVSSSVALKTEEPVVEKLERSIELDVNGFTAGAVVGITGGVVIGVPVAADTETSAVLELNGISVAMDRGFRRGARAGVKSAGGIRRHRGGSGRGEGWCGTNADHACRHRHLERAHRLSAGLPPTELSMTEGQPESERTPGSERKLREETHAMLPEPTSPGFQRWVC
eukprot:1732349-Rhodomonas_salina.2